MTYRVTIAIGDDVLSRDFSERGTAERCYRRIELARRQIYDALNDGEPLLGRVNLRLWSGRIRAGKLVEPQLLQATDVNVPAF